MANSHNHFVKRAIGGGVATLLVLAMIWALLPKPVEADLFKIARTPLRVTVDEEGKTQIRDIFVVTAPLAGTMRRTPLKAGDLVVKNETAVAVIEPLPPALRDFRTTLELEMQVKSCEANVQLAGAELRQANEELEFAQSELKRVKTLADKGISPAASLEKATTAVRVREAVVARAESALEVRRRELESAKTRLIQPDGGNRRAAIAGSCSFEVKSPASGRVLKVVAKSEQAIASGAAILELGDPSNLEVVVELLSADAVRVREGMKVAIEGWGGGTALGGRVASIEPSGFTKVSALGIEEQRVKAVIAFEGDALERERLGHDYRVFVRISVFDADNVLTVPLGALFRRGDAWSVFTAKNGRAAVRTIKIGQRNEAIAELLDGLAEGEHVIMHPNDQIADGVRIRERTEASAP
ncbi:MAG: efflux RND transporter periplasmic adaptor subunit [Hyphomicrobium sp.]